ncbi:ketoacyl-synthetase C-terminal extension domain-containing protein [Streptomyces lasalocidi]
MAVLLRRQSLAEERGDPILASIVGTAINHDGHTPALTAPNGRTQERVMHTALARSGVDPAQVDYVEAHGTGTPVGDPIEMGAIARAYGRSRTADRPLYVGSVKSNFGHTEAAAGLLGVAKAALSLSRETIYPSLHLDRLNPKIDLDGTQVEIPTESVPWPRTDVPRLAAVNSFGYSGTNAHAILREAPQPQHPTGTAKPRPAELLVLSAKSPASLDGLAEHWAEYLSPTDRETLPRGRLHRRRRTRHTPPPPRGDRAGRHRARQRPPAVADPPDLSLGHQRAPRETRQDRVRLNRPGRAVPRHGPRAVRQRTGLRRRPRPVRRSAGLGTARATAAVALREQGSGGARRHPPGPAGAVRRRVRARHPAALLGSRPGRGGRAQHRRDRRILRRRHAPLEDAARFSAVRGRLMGELPCDGVMLAVGADPETVQGWLSGREADVAVAAVNGPRAVVVSGRTEAVDEVARLAEAAGSRTTRLRTSHAFHSPLMEPVLAELGKAAAGLRTSVPAVPVFSNVTGEALTGAEGPEYWSQQVRRAGPVPRRDACGGRAGLHRGRRARPAPRPGDVHPAGVRRHRRHGDPDPAARRAGHPQPPRHRGRPVHGGRRDRPSRALPEPPPPPYLHRPPLPVPQGPVLAEACAGHRPS